MKIHITPVFAAAFIASILFPAKVALAFDGVCVLNQSSPDYTLAGSEIVNAPVKVKSNKESFTATYKGKDGSEKVLASPKLNIKLDDGVMALYGAQWMAKNNNTFYVISNSRRIVIDNCVSEH